MDEETHSHSLQPILQEDRQLAKENLDYECLEKYNEKHPIFSMSIIVERKDGEEEERPIGYHCIYHSNEHQIQLDFDLLTGLWKRNLQELNDEDEQHMLNHLFDDLYHIRCLTLDEQIQLIIQRFNLYFQEKCVKENEIVYEKNFGLSSSLFSEEQSGKIFENELIELNLYPGLKRLIIPEDDEDEKSSSNVSKDVLDYGYRSLLNGSRLKSSGLHPPPVAPRRSRQNSACSTQSSVRYASFFPPPTAPVRRRRVVESILLTVQKKKRPLEKVLDVFRPPTEQMTIYQLGLEFLHLYDGKFNYREGHTFLMSYQKRTWYLTIKKIKCVECQVGEKEPRSMLILDYKNQLTRVHV